MVATNGNLFHENGSNFHKKFNFAKIKTFSNSWPFIEHLTRL